MNTSTLKRIDSFMDRQINVLKQMLELVDDCEARKLTGELDTTELQQFKDYTADMMLACTTAQKLAKQLQPVLEKEDKEKAAKKKTKTKAKEDPKEDAAPEPKPDADANTDPNDDDMDFLD